MAVISSGVNQDPRRREIPCETRSPPGRPRCGARARVAGRRPRDRRDAGRRHTLTGTETRDHIFGRAGNDTLSGEGGSDFLHGQRGDDTLSGGEGDDYAFGGRGSDTLEGGAGNDELRGGRGADALEGGEGHDRLFAGVDDAAPDVLDCGPGTDAAVVRPGDVALECERVKVLSGTPSRVRGSVVRGTSDDDALTGADGRDFVLGRAGNDTIDGLAGNDFLFGMAGNDTIAGGDGRDRMWGGGGGDTLSGGADDDWLFPGSGSDTVSGDAGDDRIWAAADDGRVDTVDCGDGDDRAVLRPGDIAANCELVKTVS